MTRARDLADGTFANDLTVDTNTLYVDSTNNRVGVGTTSPSDLLHIYSGSSGATPSVNTRVLIEDAGNAALQILTGTTSNGQILFGDSGSAAVGRVQYEHATNDMAFYTNGSEAARIDSSGTVYFKDGGSSNPAIRFLNDTDTGIFRPSANAIAFTNGGSESARINSSGHLLVGKTATGNSTGTEIRSNGRIQLQTPGDDLLRVNRTSSDGALILLRQDGTTEGTISVSGTTVTYGGGHLARWSRLSDDSKDTSIVKGTVMTNLDQMVVWHHEAQPATYYEEGDELPEGVSVGDEKTPAVAAYDEENEQLNKMAVSSVEGDANVAGVFVNWDEDDEWNDFYVAMTGDMIIRIAQGTTVARGDLLMSAGDGTAKPQGDDIVRSKTIAKVTSTNVSHTYDDGSYCVPCVLMAC